MSAIEHDHPIQKYELEEQSGYYHDELDLAYIANSAFDVALALSRGNSVEIAYQPGDFTFYGLVFVPLWNIETAAPRVKDDQTWDHRAVRGMLRTDDRGNLSYGESAYLIAWVDHATYGLRLGNRGELAASYVAEHWSTSSVSGASLALLFRAVSWYLDRAHLLVGRR